MAVLAAIALPQYQKAVNKVRIARFLPTLVRLQRNLDLYVQTEGVFPLALDEIMAQHGQIIVMQYG